MLFASTRNPRHQLDFGGALTRGLAPDGGLYVPTEWPQSAPAVSPQDLPALATQLLAPFVAGTSLAPQLAEIDRSAFNFPAPLVPLGPGDAAQVLELFHGPTAAFKDFGARFLAACLARLPRAGGRALKILVATSGDTGGAVAAAFHHQPGIEVAVLFPHGQVSPTQERQLTCWDDNVRSLSVRGSFDDCQRLVKQAFASAPLRARFELSSANSINLGRLLPQTVFYWAASLQVRARSGAAASFVIPSGNLGNATACVWARRLGAPIETIVLAHNANRTVPDFLEQRTLRTRASVPTLSSAMDVGDPSNLERMTALFPDIEQLRAALRAVSIDDDATRARIRADFERFGRVWCPHSAVAAEAYQRLPAAERASGCWVLVATAHPAKFREIIEPLIGVKLAMPQNLSQLFDRPSSCTQIGATLDELDRSL
ncbi:MAG TPA: threonine synthase [Steroidobacteraceae bacterium]|jgi:threonine synthase